jgi:hypothetical protein
MDIANFLSTDDRLFDYLVNQFLQRFILKENDPRQRIDSTVKDAAVILGLITIAGTEPYKLLLRKNIGKLSLSIPRLAVCCFLYLVWAVFIYALINTGSFENSDLPALWFSPNALWVAAITYTILPVGLMILGFVESRQASYAYNNIPDEAILVYRGDSNFFASLILNGTDPDKVWGTHEPLTCFLASLAITALNPFIGLPLLGTSISFWVNEIFQVNNIGGCKDEKIKKALKQIAMMQNKRSGKDDFPTVN